MSLWSRTRFGAVLAALLTTSAARADDGSDIEGILEQSVVTTASQTAETQAVAPATTSVITSEDIRRHGIRSLNEALNYLGFAMFTTNPLHGGEIGARGVLITGDYGNHVLLLIDGHAVNEPYGGSASFDRGLGVPMELVDHIEVVLGPGAVLYGSNAMLGVINVVTKRVRDHHGFHFILDSELFTWGKISAGGGTTLSLFGRDVELTTQIEHQQQDGPTYTFAPQAYGDDSVTGAPKRYSPIGEGTGVWGGAARRSYYSKAPAAYLRVASGNLEIALRGSSYERASPYLDSLINPYGDFDSPANYELERWMFVDAKYRIPVTRRFDLMTRAYADLYTYDWYVTSSAAEDCGAGQVDGCRHNLHALSRWAGAEVRGTYDWLGTQALVTMIGTDARYEKVEALHRVSPQGAGDEQTSSDVDVGNVRLGLYGQQTATPVRWLALNGGARLDVAEGYPGSVSPRAAASFLPWDGSTFKAIYSRAFRAPSSYERAFEDVYTLKANHLLPEHIQSVEGSFEQRFGAQRVMIGAFRTVMTDLVSIATLGVAEIQAAQAAGANIDDSYVAQYRNVGRVENHGYNAAISGSVSQRLRYGLHLTGAYSRRRYEGGADDPITVMPSFYGNAHASYDLGEKLPTVALAAQFAGRRFTDRAFDGQFTPIPTAPPTMELRGALTGKVPMVTGLTYRLTANYAFQSRGPYVIGPLQDGSSGAQPTLNPVDRFRVGVGLHYAWDP